MQVHLSITSIGNYAKANLVEGTEGKVMGITSNGVFLLFGQHTLFLTKNGHDSPFNLILAQPDSIPPQIAAGDPVFFSQEDLLFPSRGISINLSDASVWTPPNAEPVSSPLDAQKKRAKEITQGLLNQHIQKGFLFLFQAEESDNPEQTKIRFSTHQFVHAYIDRDRESILQASSSLFGLGGGLTPSGDDWITGFVLFHTRLLTTSGNNDPFLQKIGPDLVNAAYRQTTWVSANRLEAALQGWSEDLFINVISYITDVISTDPTKIAQQLMRFGHSSGVDTFLGIAAAVDSFEGQK